MPTYLKTVISLGRAKGGGFHFFLFTFLGFYKKLVFIYITCVVKIFFLEACWTRGEESRILVVVAGCVLGRRSGNWAPSVLTCSWWSEPEPDLAEAGGGPALAQQVSGNRNFWSTCSKAPPFPPGQDLPPPHGGGGGLSFPHKRSFHRAHIWNNFVDQKQLI